MSLPSKPDSKILIINGSLGGSLGGASGNTGLALKKWADALTSHAEIEWLHLADYFTKQSPDKAKLHSLLQNADGFIFASGTYWDSWGSPLQRFLEHVTELEGSDIWLGKPAAILITMHSVGGKEVLSRLQGVLSTLGLIIPPMSGMVLSLANQLAAETPSEFANDFWQTPDLEILSHNLLEAIQQKKNQAPQWRAWNVDRKDPSRRWLKSH
ncbi:MAG: flavodoxin family protein [Bdellovibrionia bacterium]